jgi:hypothetical protein
MEVKVRLGYDVIESHSAKLVIVDKTFTPSKLIEGLNCGNLRLSGSLILNVSGDIVAECIFDDKLGSEPTVFVLESEHCTKCHSLLDGFSDCPECGSPNLTT